MKNQTLTKNLSDINVFQKYPKNYHENKHYKSVKQKIMTNQDEQEIIKFPFTQFIKGSHQNFYQNKIIEANRKIQKYKGKKCQTIPLKTISYSAPANNLNSEQISINMFKSPIKPIQEKVESKFNSKFIFTNMKKLKDLRKNNYKNRNLSSEKNRQNPNEKMLETELKLDLFKITSTNFKYQQKNHVECPEEEEVLRKMAQTHNGKRNIIKFSNQKVNCSKINKDILNQEADDKLNGVQNFIFLQPVKTEIGIGRQSRKLSLTNASVKIINQSREEDGVRTERINLKEEDYLDKVFIKYSESAVSGQDSILRKGIQKLYRHNMNEEENKNITSLQHLTSPFKASFRIKHTQDNKNVLLTTIKKKAKSLNRDQLFTFIKKVIK